MAAKHSTLTAEQLRAALHYDPETGVFTWRWRNDVAFSVNSRDAGKIAGSQARDKNGRVYIEIKIHGRKYKAHRLAWRYMTGEWPSHEIDHHDEDGLNNRWVNLRDATTSQNQANRGRQSNNTSGYKGVHFSRAKGKYEARIQYKGQKRFLGYFSDPREAHAVYCAAAEKFFGGFAHG